MAATDHLESILQLKTKTICFWERILFSKHYYINTFKNTLTILIPNHKNQIRTKLPPHL